MADVETINDMKDDEKLSALAERASQIASQIASTTDPATLRGLAAEAQSLLSAVPMGASGSGSVISRIASVIAEATSKEAAESEMEESPTSLGGSRGPGSRMSMEFQKAIYNQFMSSEERAYYDQFKASTQYSMASIDENGNITEKMVDGKQATVDGAQLKEDFARVKSYTLTEEQQATLTTPDGKKMGTMPPAEEKKELDKLEQSLGNLEGQKAQELATQQNQELKELTQQGAAPQVIEEVKEEQKEEAKQVRGKFMKARERVRELKDGLDDVEKAKKNGRRSEEEQAKDSVKLKRGRLRETLQDDVIDDALIEKKRGGKMGRDKNNELEDEMVTPANTRAGAVRGDSPESQKEAKQAVMGAKDGDESPEKPSQITGGQNVESQDLAALSPTAAGGVRSTSREMS